MKITKVIEKLLLIQKESGDLDVLINGYALDSLQGVQFEQYGKDKWVSLYSENDI